MAATDLATPDLTAPETTPNWAAARRAADEIIEAGAGTVLLFGSLARGEATEHSDIDLVAIYDDLGDYSDRKTRRWELQARAREASGFGVDVLVTDAPEWAVRTKAVPCSLEARIACDAVEIADSGQHTKIDWNKEIGLPATPTAELQERFTDLTRALYSLAESLKPADGERESAEADDEPELSFREMVRFAEACSEAHMVIESAAKVTFIVTVGSAPVRNHEIPRLLRDQPDWVRQAFADRAVGKADLDKLHYWHQGEFYSEAQLLHAFDEDYLRDHAMAAVEIATFAAEQCAGESLDRDVVRRFGQHLERCRSALDGPVRLSRS